MGHGLMAPAARHEQGESDGGGVGHRHIQTPVLDIAYREQGAPGAPPVVLLHGFPDDARSWDAVAGALSSAGYRTLAPYLRGFGPTRFLSDATPRVGQLAALARDVLDFADALGLDRFTLVGHDWGARAAQAVAATRPERVERLISLSGYAITWDGEAQAGPPSYPQLHALWYQYVLNADLGPALLGADRPGFCRYLWEVWSPTWRIPAGVFEATAPSFDNPDFVDIVIHVYRHPREDAPDDPQYAALEARLGAGPAIAVPTVVLLGADDALELPGTASPGEDRHFTGAYARHLIPRVGHFPHRERPDVEAQAVLARG